MPVVVDTTLAVPPFIAAERSRIAMPLLPAADRASAIAWNGARHPAVSAVGPGDIAGALARYVDTAAVAQALGLPGAAPGPIDAVFVECVHQFQRKVFREASQHDGRAGEATLDSLGLYLGRAALNSVDVANKKAQQHLDAINGRLPGAADNPAGAFAITAANWFRHMVNASFLGETFTHGDHAVLLRRLRRAERHLLTLPAYAGMTPVALGATLGIVESHKGARPGANTASMHTLGLAADINYLGNPWVKGADFAATLQRARLLVSGESMPAGLVAVILHGMSGRSTAAIYDTLAEWNTDFRTYLGYASNPVDLAAKIANHIADGTAGIVKPGESPAAAATRWTDRIRKDLSSLDDAEGFNGRDPRNGFLTLNRDLVIALRDFGCLAWGATDFGPNESGDIMHFDCRATGLGRVVNRGFAPPARVCPDA